MIFTSWFTFHYRKYIHKNVPNLTSSHVLCRKVRDSTKGEEKKRLLIIASSKDNDYNNFRIHISRLFYYYSLFLKIGILFCNLLFCLN